MTTSTVTAVLAFLPSPDRGVWYLGPLPLRAYALCIIAGIVVAVLWGERRFVARGGEKGAVVDIAVWAVPFGLVGGRVYHVITDWPTYFGPGGDPVDALKIWQGGLGIWGAVALGGVGAWIGCRRRGIPLPVFADAVAPGIVVAQAIGRLGNWFNQELYGAPTTLPWGLEIYRRVDPATGAPDALGGVALDRTPIAVVHPTFLYELIWNLVVAAVVVWADRRFRLGHGRVFALYVAGYTAGRFVIEQMRTDPATLVFGNLRVNVVVAAVVFVAAVFYVVLAKRGREELAPVGADPVDAADRERTPVGAGVGKGVGTGGVGAGAVGAGAVGAGAVGAGAVAAATAVASGTERSHGSTGGSARDGDAAGDGPAATDPAADAAAPSAAVPDEASDPTARPADSADAPSVSGSDAGPVVDEGSADPADGAATGAGPAATDPAADAARPSDAVFDEGPDPTARPVDSYDSVESADGSSVSGAGAAVAAPVVDEGSADPAAGDATGAGPAATDPAADAAAVDAGPADAPTTAAPVADRTATDVEPRADEPVATAEPGTAPGAEPARSIDTASATESATESGTGAPGNDVAPDPAAPARPGSAPDRGAGAGDRTP